DVAANDVVVPLYAVEIDVAGPGVFAPAVARHDVVLDEVPRTEVGRDPVQRVGIDDAVADRDVLDRERRVVLAARAEIQSDSGVLPVLDPQPVDDDVGDAPGRVDAIGLVVAFGATDDRDRAIGRA